MSKTSNTNSINWSSELTLLSNTKKIPAAFDKLKAAGIKTLFDLIYIFPLKIDKIPAVTNFNELSIRNLFHGKATVTSSNVRPQFWSKGKNRSLLYQVNLVVKDKYSDQFMYLSWFNIYKNLKEKLLEIKEIEFIGTVTEFKNLKQIINPEFTLIENDPHFFDQALRITYPTINTVPGETLKNLIQKVPSNLWDKLEENIPNEVLLKRGLLTNIKAFKTIHLINCEYDKTLFEQARRRLVYNDFFNDQLKIMARKSFYKKETSPKFFASADDILGYKKQFKYVLTPDQDSSLSDILKDLNSGHPMMRLLQGDVGSGKTTVAIIAALIVLKHGKQVALMCPTETLAGQHFSTITTILSKFNFKIGLLLGSHTTKEKKSILNQLKTGQIDLMIGTHSLFQDSVEFSNLGLAIIDEQHKFGVEQRIRLTKKGIGVHCLIMTATPIPRSLSLTQYGDLDFSVIKTMPNDRKGIKTRIVESINFNKYLSFIKTRLDLNEQIYIVVPSIEDSEKIEMESIQSINEKYKTYFPDVNIGILHGRIDSKEKMEIFEKFLNRKIKLLISTSVIEVGINNVNATVMAIHNPERFGLSQIHQLRGRVGRGIHPGFCFLIISEKQNPEIISRLSIFEKTNDGFEIAEEDLIQRGEGDLFGTEQSGVNYYRLANIVKHKDLLEEAIKDILEFKGHQLIQKKIESLKNDPKIFSTI